MSLFVAILFIVESLSTALWLAGFLSVVTAYDATVIVLALARTVVTMGLCASAGMLFRRTPPAFMFARWSVIASAIVLTLELGFNLAPTNVFPSHRWPVVGAYWLYAATIVMWTRRAKP